MNKGYIYVASVNKAYYYAAKKSAESLLDFYPEAKITLFTHDFWVELGADIEFVNDKPYNHDLAVSDDIPYTSTPPLNRGYDTAGASMNKVIPGGLNAKENNW